MSHKAIFIDLDGTLLDSRHQLRSYSIETLHRIYNEYNIPVILTSARLPDGVKLVQDILQLNCPVITLNGTYILEDIEQGTESKILLDQRLTNLKMIDAVINCAQNFEVQLWFYEEWKWYVSVYNEWVQAEEVVVQSEPLLMGQEELMQEWQSRKTGPNKILAIGDIAPMRDYLEHHFAQELDIQPSAGSYLEIVPHACSKASAVRFLRKQYQAKRSEIICFGDNYNDEQMLRYAGLGVAVDNAPAAIKAAADQVTLSNNEEGVAAFLQNLFPEMEN